MDNASKALIMAGAILISVAIVGIGIYIFSTANALTDDAVGQIDSLAVSSVNSRLQAYMGNSVRGSVLKQLVREVNTINRNNSMPVQVRFDNDGKNITRRDTSNEEIAAGVPIVFSLGAEFKENRRYYVNVKKPDNPDHLEPYNSAGYIQWIDVGFAD